MVELTSLANKLGIDGEFLSCSVDAGFILALSLHHRDLAVKKFRLKIMLLAICGLGACA